MHQVPFEAPTAQSKPPAAAKLDEKQQKDYQTVLDHFTAKADQYKDSERAWLSRECILRYLRATNWQPEHAIKRLVSTLEWRTKFGVEKLTADYISPEYETGKSIILGWDNGDRPCLYLKPGRQNTKTSHRQVEALVFMLERVITMMQPGQDQLALLIDFQPVNIPNSQASKLPGLSTGREVLSILQDHYPERLGKALLTNMPRLAKLFLKMIHPFIDPLTREKLVFSEPFVNYVPKEQLEAEYGGECEFEYDHNVYWPALIELTEKRHQDFMAKFNQLGGKIGLSESAMRGDESNDVNGTAATNGTTNDTTKATV